MKHNRNAMEALLAAAIVLVLLLVQVVGTTTVTDESAALDEEGYPVTDKTFDDFLEPGTRFGILTGTDWAMDVEKRYPEARIVLTTPLRTSTRRWTREKSTWLCALSLQSRS